MNMDWREITRIATPTGWALIIGAVAVAVALVGYVVTR
jgi:hypothetical protein